MKLPKLVAFTTVYFLLCQVGRTLSLPGLFASPVWPPAGFALAVLLLSHQKNLWLGVFVGSMAHMLLQKATLSTSLCIALTHLLEFGVGVSILRGLWGERRSLNQVNDVLALALIAAPLSSLLSATLGIVSLDLNGVISSRQVPFAWWTWWTGNMLADLIVAPFLLVWAAHRQSRVPRALQIEASFVVAAGLGAAYFIFGKPYSLFSGPYPVAYLIFPMVIWAALRFKQLGVVTAVFMISLIAIVNTRLGNGPFAVGNEQENLLRLQAFMAVISITGLVLGGAISAQIESQEMLKRSIDQQQTLISSIDGIVWEADARTFEFLFVSQQAERLLGYPIEQWLNDPTFWKSHIHPDDRDWAVEFCLNCIEHFKAHDFEYRMIAADGREVWLRDIVSVETEDGIPTKLRGIMVDITDKKIIEQKREEFLAISAHELRTPLTPIRLQMHVLKRQLAELESHDAKIQRVESTLSIANTQLDRLTQLVEKLLDISQITLGHLELSRQNCDLTSIIQNVLERHQIEIANARCELSIDLTPNAWGEWDPLRLEQVFSNLLTNAVKYGAGKPIEIKSRIKDHKAYMIVSDHGIGIAPLDQGRIFNRFERGVSIARYGGIGLGLYISRLIVEKHGGTISVTSLPQQGAQFTVELPAA